MGWRMEISPAGFESPGNGVGLGRFDSAAILYRDPARSLAIHK